MGLGASGMTSQMKAHATRGEGGGEEGASWLGGGGLVWVGLGWVESGWVGWCLCLLLLGVVFEPFAMVQGSGFEGCEVVGFSFGRPRDSELGTSLRGSKVRSV